MEKPKLLVLIRKNWLIPKLQAWAKVIKEEGKGKQAFICLPYGITNDNKIYLFAIKASLGIGM